MHAHIPRAPRFLTTCTALILVIKKALRHSELRKQAFLCLPKETVLLQSSPAHVRTFSINSTIKLNHGFMAVETRHRGMVLNTTIFL